MRNRILYFRGLSVFCSVLAVLFCTSVSLAAHHNDDKTNASDVKKEAMETYDVMKSYTLEQRDEAMDAAEDRIEKLDVQISQMEEAVDNKWQDMSQATRERTRNTLDTLRENREELAEWLGGLRYSSKEAWEEVKIGFADSYDRLKSAFIQASKDFDKDKDK